MKLIPTLGAIFVLSLCRTALARDLVFSGSLERVRNGSISVRLANSRPIDAVLPRSGEFSDRVIAEHFSVGDQVEISCRPIGTVYDAAAALHEHLELTRLRLLRPGSPIEHAQELAILSWQSGENLLKQPPGASFSTSAPGEIERVRRVNLEYFSKLPDFVADETARRYSSDIDAPKWRLEDTIESEVAVKGLELAREHIRRNGKAWKRSYADLEGMKWGAFGRELRPVFDPACPTKIEFSGTEEMGGKQFQVYRFSSPPDGCFSAYPLLGERNQHNPARSGRIMVDAASANVMRYEEEASGFPEQFFLDRRLIVETWDFVKIGDASYLVPTSAEFVARRAEGITRRTVIEYNNHRHFEASTAVRFDR